MFGSRRTIQLDRCPVLHFGLKSALDAGQGEFGCMFDDPPEQGVSGRASVGARAGVGAGVSAGAGAGAGVRGDSGGDTFRFQEELYCLYTENSFRLIPGSVYVALLCNAPEHHESSINCVLTPYRARNYANRVAGLLMQYDLHAEPIRVQKYTQLSFLLREMAVFPRTVSLHRPSLFMPKLAVPMIHEYY